MNSFQAAASFPFTGTDPANPWRYFTLPPLRVEVLLESHRKNAAALTAANQVAFRGLTTLAQRQSDLLKTTVDEYSKIISDVLAAASFEDKATRQADAVRYVYDSTVNRSLELCDIATSTNVAAAEILRARATQVFDELKSLFAAPAEPPAAALPEPAPVVAELPAPAVAEPPSPAVVEPPAVAEPVAQARESDRDELDQDEDAEAPVRPARPPKAAPRTSPTASASTDRKGKRR